MASNELLSQVDDSDTVELTEKLVLLRTRAQDLESVKKLNCWASNIKDVSVVRRLPNLEVCSLSINKLTTLRDFAHCYNLQELYVRTNNIQCLGDIHYLKNLPKLRSLWLSENPCASKDNYRMTVLKTLPRLQKLDNVVVTEDELARATIEGDDVPIPEDFSYSSVFTSSSSTEDDKDVDKNDASESCNKWALPRRKRHQKKREDQIKERLSLDDVSIKSSHDGDVMATSREYFKSDGDVSPRRNFGEDTKSDGDLTSPIMEDVKSDGDVGPRTFRADIKSDVDVSARSQDLNAICWDANQKFEEAVTQVDKILAVKSEDISETSKEEIVFENGDNYNVIGAKLCGDKKDFKCYDESIADLDKETQQVSELTYEEAEFELPLKRCFGKTHLPPTVPEILPNLDLDDVNFDLVHDEAFPVPAAGVDIMSDSAAPDGTNINNSATESSKAVVENSQSSKAVVENSQSSQAVVENSQSSNAVVDNRQRVVSLLDRIQLDDVMDSTEVDSSVKLSQNGREEASDQTALAPEVICQDNVLTPGQSLNVESRTLAVKEPIDWDECNRLRIQAGLKPWSRVPSTAKFINSDILRTRNSNILGAVLSLVKELDKDSLEIVSSAVKSRLETFS